MKKTPAMQGHQPEGGFAGPPFARCGRSQKLNVLMMSRRLQTLGSMAGLADGVPAPVGAPIVMTLTDGMPGSCSSG